jgi:glucan biosynthesis protein C
VETQQRFHGLDAVRAFALLGGIVLHGTMSFLPDLNSMQWPLADVSESLTLEVVFYVIHIFRMAAFFLIAGFFARMVFHRKGPAEFIRDRVRRIVGPMLVGWVILMPLTVAVIVTGGFISAGESMLEREPPPNTGLPLVHLWFLYYLVIFYALTLCVRELLVRAFDANGHLRNLADRSIRALVSTELAPLIFAVPTVICLCFTPGWTWPGVPPADTGLTPKVPTLIAYGMPFAFGWLLHRQIALLEVFSKRWLAHLVIAVGATAGAWYVVGAPMRFDAPVPDGEVKLAYAALYTLAMWSWVFALIGIGLRFFSSENPKLRYLADSSYWMYLIHLPVLWGLALATMRWDLHWSVKFPLLMAVTFGLLLASYRYLVRNTWIGKILNGRRVPPAARPETQVQSHA